jgi:hypothetical protein
MTHERRGAALMGAGAAVVLVADLGYATSHWTGSFRYSFLLSLAGMALVAVISFAFRVIGPVGTGRRAARWNQRATNVVLIVVIVAFIEVSNRAGGSGAGSILGVLAGLTGGFAIYTAIWLARQSA